MPRFRVMLNGQNFLLAREQGAVRMGFFTSRFVEAATPDEAQVLAVQTIRDDPKFAGIVLNDEADPPTILAKEIQEVETDATEVGADYPNQGYTFYEEKSY